MEISIAHFQGGDVEFIDMETWGACFSDWNEPTDEEMPVGSNVVFIVTRTK